MILDDIERLASFPTSVRPDAFDDGCAGVHESTLRGWQVLQFAVGLLRRGVPADIVAEIAEGIMEWK